MPSDRRCTSFSIGHIGVVSLTCLLLLGGLAAPVLGQQTSVSPETDNTITRIQLHSNGDAVWVVQIRTRLASDQDVNDYESFQETVRENRSVLLDPFQSRMMGVAAQAGNVTGRPMRATNFSVETSIQEVPRRWGVVTYRFRWTAFAQTEGDQLVVGDVFDTGFFLSEDDVLEVAAPPGYEVTSVSPSPDSSGDGTVSWVGREDFADRRPRVTAQTSAGATTEPPGESGDGDGETSAGGTASPVSTSWIMAAVVLVVALVMMGWVIKRRRSATASPGPTPSADPEPSIAPDEREPADSGDIMTDEERVEEALRSHGGRMRQAEIADALDWSTSKTSRVLTGMAESGRVEKLQLGRENVIDLPDETEPE
ncbi:MAG: helix-turn-helix domain-containing protein [Halobacteriales archaeon]|nr:helix-turn-helix domain-containing protein [Halobacteriales archaeon]